MRYLPQFTSLAVFLSICSNVHAVDPHVTNYGLVKPTPPDTQWMLVIKGFQPPGGFQIRAVPAEGNEKPHYQILAATGAIADQALERTSYPVNVEDTAGLKHVYVRDASGRFKVTSSKVTAQKADWTDVDTGKHHPLADDNPLIEKCTKDRCAFFWSAEFGERVMTWDGVTETYARHDVDIAALTGLEFRSIGLKVSADTNLDAKWTGHLAGTLKLKVWAADNEVSAGNVANFLDLASAPGLIKTGPTPIQGILIYSANAELQQALEAAEMALTTAEAALAGDPTNAAFQADVMAKKMARDDAKVKVDAALN